MRYLVAFVVFDLFLSSCGFKGPLYLPPTEHHNSETKESVARIQESAGLENKQESSVQIINPIKMHLTSSGVALESKN